MTRSSTWIQPQNTYRGVTGTRLRATDKAILIQVSTISGSPAGVKDAHWFPYSQIEKSVYDPNAQAPNWKGMVAEWILERNGLLTNDPVENEDPGDNTPEAYAPGHDDDIPF